MSRDVADSRGVASRFGKPEDVLEGKIKRKNEYGTLTISIYYRLSPSVCHIDAYGNVRDSSREKKC